MGPWQLVIWFVPSFFLYIGIELMKWFLIPFAIISKTTWSNIPGFYNESIFRRLLNICSSVTPNTHSMPRYRKWKTIPPPLNLGSIEEEEGQSEYDCGYLDLGAETPNTSTSHFQGGTPHLPRQRSFRRASSPANKPNRLGKRAVDRDCGIW